MIKSDHKIKIENFDYVTLYAGLATLYAGLATLYAGLATLFGRPLQVPCIWFHTWFYIGFPICFWMYHFGEAISDRRDYEMASPRCQHNGDR